MKKNKSIFFSIIFAFIAIFSTSCTKEETPTTNKDLATVQIKATRVISDNGMVGKTIDPESIFTLTGDINGKPFNVTTTKDEIETIKFEFQPGGKAYYNFTLKSEKYATFSVDIYVNGKLAAKYGNSCDGLNYEKTDYVLLD